VAPALPPTLRPHVTAGELGDGARQGTQGENSLEGSSQLLVSGNVFIITTIFSVKCAEIAQTHENLR
jgi:hypothetical protein